ncbi:MAG: DUF3800 domain-containing protein [Nocardioidaceae bacterium]|nr:DUF3800 domain-containing protein [Nocardioidaceae bacterium]
MSRPLLHAYVDEAGQRSHSARSSDHFVMSAVLVDDDHREEARALLGGLRVDLGRKPDQVLHWRNIKQHSAKLHMARTIGQAPFLQVCSVVVCKRHLDGTGMDEDTAYLYTFRFLLERMSWLAGDSGHELHYTLAHIVRFKLETLREYERRLRAMSDCTVRWSVVTERGGRLDQPVRVEELQLADAVASATYAAFEPDGFGNVENRYLRELSPRMWRRGAGSNALTSYGLKIHPWRDITKAAYPWVAAL